MPASQGFIAPRPGDIEILAITISNYDGSESQNIQYLTLEFNIYESLGADHLRADLIITDTLSLVTRLPIVGDETVSISFRTPSQAPDSYEYEPITLSFRVVGLEKLQTGNIRDEFYKLVLVVPQRLADLKSIVQDALEGTAGSMVQQVANQYLQIQNLRLGAANSMHRFVIPSMTPCETIHFIASEARSASVASSNFIFYQDHKQHNFITTEELLNDQVQERYFVTEQSLTHQPGQAIQGRPTGRQSYANNVPIDTTGLELADKYNTQEFRNMHSIVFDKTFDVETNLMQGMYDNIAFWIDPIMQEYMAAGTGSALGGQFPTGGSGTGAGGAGAGGASAFEYLTNFPAFKHTAQRDTGHPVISAQSGLAGGSGQSSVRYLISNKNQGMNPKFMVLPRQRQDFIEMLSSYIGQNDSTVCTLSIPGDSNRKAGDNIYFDLHEIGATDDILFELNKYLSGKFLVTAVRHKYTYDAGYTTVLQCIKNCYEAEIQNEPATRQATAPQQPPSPLYRTSNTGIRVQP